MEEPQQLRHTNYMRYLKTLLALFITAAPSWTQTTDAKRIQPVAMRAPERRALLIGNKSYPKSKLANPVHDVEDLAKALGQIAFKVQVLTDATMKQTNIAIEQFASGLVAGDIALLFYSGHGLQIDAENYLVPIDFAAANETQAKAQSVPFSKAKSMLEASRASLVVMILDSCRDNPFTTPGRPTKGLAALEADLGAYIAFAASPGQTASDNSRERNGLFTKYLLAALLEPLNVSELFRKVRQQVYEASEKRQLPYVHDQVVSDMYLRSHTVTAPSQSPAQDVFDKAKERYYQKDCNQAIEAFDLAVRRDPGNAMAHNALGMAYVCAQMYALAAKSFSMAIQLNPAMANAYLNRGQVFLLNAQYELALQDFDWAVEQDPTDAVSHWHRGKALFGLRRYEDAQAAYSNAIQANPSDSNGFHGRAQVLHQLGKYKEALADFDSALARKQDWPIARADRERTRLRLASMR